MNGKFIIMFKGITVVYVKVLGRAVIKEIDRLVPAAVNRVQ
jgi:hypothetical protein